jgi:hypothetical protein
VEKREWRGGFRLAENKRPHPWRLKVAVSSVASINRRKCGRARSTIDVRRKNSRQSGTPLPHGPDLSRFVEIGERMARGTSLERGRSWGGTGPDRSQAHLASLLQDHPTATKPLTRDPAILLCSVRSYPATP